jgi:hypothetical protein
MGRKTQRRNGSTARDKGRVHVADLPKRRQAARERGLHVLAAMRRDPKLSLTQAAKLQGVKRDTVKKYFSSALKQSQGKFRVTKGDRYSVTLYVPDHNGKSVEVRTRSSKEREALGQYLRDLGRYLGGKLGTADFEAKWNGKKIAGVELVTDRRTLVSIEPALSGFGPYRSFNGGRQ